MNNHQQPEKNTQGTWQNKPMKLPEHYGIFPYIMVREFYAIYRQITIQYGYEFQCPNEGLLFFPWDNFDNKPYRELLNDPQFIDAMLELAEQVSMKTNKKVFLAFSPTFGYHFFETGKQPVKCDSIPRGGTLLSATHKK